MKWWCKIVGHEWTITRTVREAVQPVQGWRDLVCFTCTRCRKEVRQEFGVSAVEVKA